MQWFRLSRRALLQGTAALGLAAAARPRLGRAQDGSVLRVRSYSDLQVLDPAHRKAQPEGDIMRCIYTKLIDYEPGDEWEWRPTGAAAIEQVDPTHVRFTLRPGIMLTNGFGEMTAEDVKSRYERIADPERKSEYADDWAQLDHVEVIDKYSGVIVLKEPFAPLWTSSLPGGTGSHRLQEGGRAGGRQLHDRAAGDCRPLRDQGVAAQAAPDAGAQPGLERRARRLRGDPRSSRSRTRRRPSSRFEAGELDYTAVASARCRRYEASPPPGAQADPSSPRSPTSGSA